MTNDYFNSARDDTLADGIRRVHEASGGVLDVYLVDAKAAAKLLGGGMLGDAAAARLFGAFLEAGKRIASASRRSPVICASCPRRIRRVTHDIVFGIAAPGVTNRPSSAIGFAICGKCAAN